MANREVRRRNKRTYQFSFPGRAWERDRPRRGDWERNTTLHKGLRLWLLLSPDQVHNFPLREAPPSPLARAGEISLSHYTDLEVSLTVTLLMTTFSTGLSCDPV